MPSIARIVTLIFLLLLPPGVRAQTISNTPAKQSPAEDTDQWWAKPLAPSSAPVVIPPPVAASDNTVPLSPPNRESRIPLSLSGKTNSTDTLKKSDGLPSMVTVAGSLGVVLGIFLLAAWLMRRAAPHGLTRLPNEAFEVLGRSPLIGRQNVHLLRCGNKLLLVSITPAGTETLTEITDPQEVDRLAGLCQQAGPQSSTAAFRRIFEQLAPKRPSRAALSHDEYPQNEYADYDASESELSETMSWEQRDG